MVQQPAAVQRVGLPVRDLRLGGERVGLAREGLHGPEVARLDAEAYGVGQQVLDLLEFLGIAVETLGQRGHSLRQRAILLAVQAAGQGQRADEPVPEPLGVRARGRQVPAGRVGLAPVEADHGGDAEIAAGYSG